MEEKQGNKYGSRRPGTLWFFVFLFNKVAGSFPTIIRSSHPVVFLEKGVLKICSNVRGEHSCRSVISIKLQSNFVEITLRHGCFPVNFLHIFRKPFSKNTSGWLLLNYYGRTSSWIFDKKIYDIFQRIYYSMSLKQFLLYLKSKTKYFIQYHCLDKFDSKQYRFCIKQLVKPESKVYWSKYEIGKSN